jgi:CHASE1-domain containing sensor protein
VPLLLNQHALTVLLILLLLSPTVLYLVFKVREERENGRRRLDRLATLYRSYSVDYRERGR